MRTKTLLILVVLVSLSFAVGEPAAAQEWSCARCTASADCETAAYANACQCKIRFRGPVQICREEGVCPGFCDPDPPPFGGQPGLRTVYLDQLFEVEPLLAAVLFGSQSVDEENGVVWFNVESYSHGTLVLADGTPFTHSADFLPSFDEVRFRIELRNDTTGEDTTFVGAVRERGRRIPYHRITEDGPARHDWTAEPVAE